MPVRRLHNYIYCPRLFYFQWVENVFQDNADTVAGRHIHRNVDASSSFEGEKVQALEAMLPEGARIRSLRLESDSLGLIGVVDLVEGGSEGPEVVDYKRGAARRDSEGDRTVKEPDAFQVAAHALLLREHGISVSRGAVYYAADKRRVPVELSEELYQRVRVALSEAKAIAASGLCPAPLTHDPRCLYCSAYPICLPNESLWWARQSQDYDAKSQMHFPFLNETRKAARDRFVDAADFSTAGISGEPTFSPPRAGGDDREVLVVQTAGAHIGQRGDQLLITVGGEEVRKVPGHQVRAIYCYGAIQMTAQAIATCLELSINVSYFSAAGRFLGMLGGLPASGVDARRGQYRLFELAGARLQLAREIIRAKIHNQRVMLMRNAEAPDSAVSVMAGFRDAAERASDMETLLGIEGASAALYFQHFETMLKSRDGYRFDWQGRNRRPPRDPVNALLSIGYSMLAKELTGVCYAVGLDPFLGFLHQPRYGRPALALDLMEEFRPLIADSVAVSLINRGEIGPEDFFRSASGTFLNECGRRAFWEAWFRRLDTEVTHPEFGYKMAYRRMLEVQVRQLWRFLRGEARTYHGFVTR